MKKINLLSIGELSQKTGISTHTLRIWEKRYGAPQSIRLPSGHRRYLPEEVERLRAVARALDLGFRAGQVVGGTQDELDRLLGLEALGSSRVPRSIPNQDETSLIFNQWIDQITEFDDENLAAEMHRQWGLRGPLDFIIHIAAPLIIRIDKEWKEGRLSVAQEHFATDLLSNFLGDRWRRQNEHKDGPIGVLTTLTGERHSLGLSMCAAVMSVTDWKVVSLGLDVPEEEIITTVNRLEAPLLCVSISEWYGTSRAKPILWRLHKALRPHTHIMAGGGGAPSNLTGIETLEDFKGFFEWLTINIHKTRK